MAKQNIRHIFSGSDRRDAADGNARPPSGRLRAEMPEHKKTRREKRDFKIINANAKHLNAEAKDVFEYQATR